MSRCEIQVVYQIKVSHQHTLYAAETMGVSLVKYDSRNACKVCQMSISTYKSCVMNVSSLRASSLLLYLCDARPYYISLYMAFSVVTICRKHTAIFLNLTFIPRIVKV